MLETKRLILRPWRESDAESLYCYASDPDVGPAAGWPVHTSVEDSRRIIKQYLSAPGTYAVCRKEDNLAIGSVGLKMGPDTDLTERDTECELGYWVGKPFWGQGIIPEAAEVLIRYGFEVLHMDCIWCGRYQGNEKSRRVQEKLGFVYQYTTEGVEVPLLGETRTGYVSCLTRENWLKRKK